jgi:hypothetical protein
LKLKRLKSKPAFSVEIFRPISRNRQSLPSRRRDLRSRPKWRKLSFAEKQKHFYSGSNELIFENLLFFMSLNNNNK